MVNILAVLQVLQEDTYPRLVGRRCKRADREDRRTMEETKEGRKEGNGRKVWHPWLTVLDRECEDTAARIFNTEAAGADYRLHEGVFSSSNDVFYELREVEHE